MGISNFYNRTVDKLNEIAEDFKQTFPRKRRAPDRTHVQAKPSPAQTLRRDRRESRVANNERSKQRTAPTVNQPSSAARAAQRHRRPKLGAYKLRSPRVGLRSKYRGTGSPQTSSSSGGSVRMRIWFYEQDRLLGASDLGPNGALMLQRWADIMDGKLPDDAEDTDLKKPPAEDDVNEEILETIKKLTSDGRAKAEEMMTEAHIQADDLIRQSEDFYESAAEVQRTDPDEARHLETQAERFQERAEDIMSEARRAVELLSDEIREQRDEYAEERGRQYQKELDQYEEDLAQYLNKRRRSLIEEEIQPLVDQNYFHGGSPPINEVEFE